MENVFIITQLLQEQQYLQEQKFKQIYSLKTYGYKLWETEKRNQQKKFQKKNIYYYTYLLPLASMELRKGKNFTPFLEIIDGK